MNSINATDVHRLTCCSAYTSAVFSETRYALNGTLRVAYRTSREGPRDIVMVNWLTNCEVFPELPSLQGMVEAMTSLGRLILFDQPGTGASDPVTPNALPSLEQWADSITSVLDELGSQEAVIVAIDGAFAPAALFVATRPSRTSALVVLEGYADPLADRTEAMVLEESRRCRGCDSGQSTHPERIPLLSARSHGPCLRRAPGTVDRCHRRGGRREIGRAAVRRGRRSSSSGCRPSRTRATS